MSLTNKVAQFDADSDLVNRWVHGPAVAPGDTVLMGSSQIRTPAKLIADVSTNADVESSAAISAAIGANFAILGTVASNIADVNAVVDNLALIQASPANAFIASESAAYISTFVDAITLRDMAFPLDLGLVIDPVPVANTFDLGAI